MFRMRGYFLVANILVEKFNDIMTIKVTGKLTFDEVVDTIKSNYHMITCHLLWDLTNSDLDEISSGQFRKILSVVKEFRPKCAGGKLAYVSSIDSNYGMSRMFSVLAEMSNISHPYQAFRSYEEAVEWLHT